jgi:drug/metabolite transporter superfamily protein YnfA
MSFTQTNEPTFRKPLRLWPGVALAIVVVLTRYVAAVVAPDAMVFGVPLFIVGALTGIAGGLAIVLWWLFLSRAPWSERLGAIALTIVALLATLRVVHESIANGMMGNMLYVIAIPALSLALVAGAAAGRRLTNGPRRATMAVAILLACGVFTLLRTGGVTGEGVSDLHWRWTPTPEDRLLALGGDVRATRAVTTPAAAEAPEKRPLPEAGVDTPAPPSSVPAAAKTAEKPPIAHAGEEEAALPSDPPGVNVEAAWPGFRGPGRDGVVRGVRIETDWAKSPPVALWRRPIGPGWSSFAVGGDLLYTQEQRGEDEVVAAYNVNTGEPVWKHHDAARFWESNAGAGPRGTPTLGHGRVYTFGATGIVNALDAADGTVVWSRSAASDAGRKVPEWGFSSSPLVVDDLVVVAASGRLVAYDSATGTERWVGPARGGSYSSPQLVTIDGVSQILMLSGAGATSFAPADGSVLWEHAWPGFRIVQPALTADRDVLMSDANAMGGVALRRIGVAHGAGGWTAEERWTSPGLKPYFNDIVVHKGHAFGFDGSILACIDLVDGKRRWKGGRFGHGQLLLLPDQDLLLVLSEDGELALVGATTDQFKEVARVPALEGKTWNHPVLVGDVLLVRNDHEMAAFRLASR